MKLLEKLRLKFQYVLLPKLIRNWFAIFLGLVCVIAFKSTYNNTGDHHFPKCEVSSDRPGCYIFHGMAQHDIIKKGRLNVNFLIEGFPKLEHDVFVEVVDSKGEVDFLYSDKHSPSHKAHYVSNGGMRIYKTSYKIPALKPGKYKLRVTFRFHEAIGYKKLVSNDISFEVVE